MLKFLLKHNRFTVFGLGRSPEGGNGSTFQHSCLDNPTDREAGGIFSIGSQRVGHN